MRIKYYIIILLSTATYSCSTNSFLSGNEKAKIPEDVRKTLNDYHADVHRIGLTEEFNYSDNSDDLYWDPPGYPSAVSFDSVAAVLKQNAPLYTSINNRWDTLRISILHNELASYTGRLHSTINDASGNVPVFRLVETGLLIKRKSGKHLDRVSINLFSVTVNLKIVSRGVHYSHKIWFRLYQPQRDEKKQSE